MVLFLRPMKLAPVTPRSAFQERQRRLSRALAARGSSEACLAAGFARPRNFAHNVFPFRAESHFLYLVGCHLEGALFAIEQGEPRLYVPEPDPEAALWSGAQKTPTELESELEMPVFTLGEYEAHPLVLTLPPQDEESAEWLSSHVGRSIEAQSGPELRGSDVLLAEAMVELRLRHDPAALGQLEFAAQASALAHLAGMACTLTSRYEFEVRAQVEAEMQRHDLFPAYTSIVTVRGDILHNSSSKGALTGGPLLLCDAGAETGEGFAGDITRTWPTSGKYEGAARDAYLAVLNVQKRAIASVRPGVSFRELHYMSCLEMAGELTQLGLLRGSAEELVASGATAVFYPHGLGHLLGVDVHDLEDLGDRAGYGSELERDPSPAFRALRLGRVLEEDMVVTVEPGLYFSPLLLARARQDPSLYGQIQWPRLEPFLGLGGIRIEDDVQVRSAGSRVLSEAVPKELGEVEARISA
jgi:Xaa-Pro aminopeptidase